MDSTGHPAGRQHRLRRASIEHLPQRQYSLGPERQDDLWGHECGHQVRLFFQQYATFCIIRLSIVWKSLISHTAFNSATDLFLAVFPTLVFWNLNLKLRIKISLILLLSLGVV